MGESNDLPRLYIAVDPSKLVRCAWCGTLESDNWKNEKRRSYCSIECVSAAKASTHIGPCFAFLLFLGIPVVINLMGRADGFFYAILCLIGGIWFIGDYYVSKKHASEIPFDSRRPEITDELSLLKTTMTHVECPNCDGNIDIASIGEDQVYHCGYCGASGVLEVTFTD